MQSRDLGDSQRNPSGIAVYRDPYLSLRKTAQLLASHPSLASCVRRIWFIGYHGAETNEMIFNILRKCTNLDYLTLPWTALRYGDAEDWASLLERNGQRHGISSLEILAIDLKASEMTKPENRVDRHPLASSKLDFSRLNRLKLFGQSSFMPLVDDDLFSISQTAVNLKEIHIIGTTDTLSFDGVAALIDPSDRTLEVLEYSPLTAGGFTRTDPAQSSHLTQHFCRRIRQCTPLCSIAVSLPSLCEDFFGEPSVAWQGEMQIRTSNICGLHPLTLKTSEKAQDQVFCILDKARGLMTSRDKGNAKLDIEIFIGNWIFEPRKSMVHGNLQQAGVLSDGAWPQAKYPSSKGPYGQTDLSEKNEGLYQCVSEKEFKVGLECRLVSL